MFTTFREANEWLQSRLKFGIKPGLERMHVMMELLNHPERRPKYIHVAGTNGKGSTIAFLNEILQQAGYVVGTYTSPSLETIHERISVNGVPISDEEFIHLVNTVKPVAEKVEQTEFGAPTEFEVMTAMMFDYFGRVNIPDVVLLETGLGGTYDSTNIISPLISIITSIGHDHMGILGESLEEIASQKAGIIKSGVPVMTAVQASSLLSIIEKTATSKKARVYSLNKHFSILEQNERLIFRTPFHEYENVKLGLSGTHQRSNAILAVMAANYLTFYYSFQIERKHIKEGLEKTFWKGRFEQVSKDPTIVLDGAHNVEGVTALKETVRQSYPNRTVHVIFSAMKDKETKEMIDILSSFAHRIMFTSFANPRAKQAKALYDEADVKLKFYEEDWVQSIERMKQTLSHGDVLIITGSLYFIGEVRKLFVNN